MVLSLSLTKSKEELVRKLGDVSAQGEVGASQHGYASEVAAVLSHQSPEVVIAALEALGSMGDEGAWFSSDVAGKTAATTASVRCAAFSALGLFGSTSTRYAALLTKGMNDNEEGVRAASIVAVGQVGLEEEVANLVSLLEDKSPVVVAAACQALGLLACADESQIAAIAQKLNDPTMRYAAVTSLADIGEHAVTSHIDEIIKTCLKDNDSMTRNVAASSLGVATDAVLQRGVEDIKALLNSDHAGVRCTGALAFGYLGERALAHAGDVAALLEDETEDLSEMHLQVGGVAAGSPPTSRRPKCAALAALGMMRAEEWARTCAKALGDDSFEVRLCALECLSHLGDAGRAQSSDIGALLEDNTVFVRAKACEVIGTLLIEDAMTSLPEVFGDRAPSVRVAALYALAESPRISESFSSEVLKLFSDPFPPVKAAAVTVIGNLEDLGQPYASTIASVLNEEEDIGVKIAAIDALGKLGRYGAAFADDIAYYAQEGDPVLQASALSALEMLRSYTTARFGDINMMVGDME